MLSDDLRELRQRQRRELAVLLARHKHQRKLLETATRDYTLTNQQEGTEQCGQTPAAQEGGLDNEHV